MAISPPSDLVLDVVRAADPAQVQEAQARLKSNRAAFQASSLAENGNGFANTVAVLNRDSPTHSLGDITNRAEQTKIPETYRKFEAMVLQNFVKSMLPKDSEEVYGKGTAGDIWKGMMAEQVANVIAEGDGIGIAKSMMTDRIVGTDGPDRVNARLDGNDNNVAMSMVQEYQRKAVDSFLGDDTKKRA
jgi:peptidoglycan hydrolase FlgJ